LLLVLASAVILGSESHGTRDHILLPQIRDSPNLEGQVHIFISPKNRVARLYPQALGSLFVVSYDSQGYGGGIRTRVHTGLYAFFSKRPRYPRKCLLLPPQRAVVQESAFHSRIHGHVLTPSHVLCLPGRFLETPTCHDTFILKTLSYFKCPTTTNRSSCKRLKRKFLRKCCFHTSNESVVNPPTAIRQHLLTSQDVITLSGHVTCLQTLTVIKITFFGISQDMILLSGHVTCLQMLAVH
jgi:hypothetical protein